MFALFTAVPLVGHINPLLNQALEFQRRGWRVAFAGARELAVHVSSEAPQVPFIDLGPIGPLADRLRADQAAASAHHDFALGTLGIVRGLGDLWPMMFEGLVAAIDRDRPDVMVVDLFTAAGLCAAEHRGIPFVINNADVLGAISVRVLPPADHLPLLFSGASRNAVPWWQPGLAPLIRWIAATGASWTVGRDLNRHRRARGLAPVDIHERLRGRPIIVDGVFGLEYERPLPDEIVMAGPMLPSPLPVLPPDIAQWLDDGPPVVYANLGTLAVASDRQLQVMADALADEGRRALWILRDDHARRLPRVPANVRIMSWGPPPLAVLAHRNVMAFLTHCGINSVYEAIVAGTPIVGIPMFADQRDMAVMAADAGAGVWFDRRQLSAESVRTGIERVMTEARFKDSLAPLQHAIALAGGTARAADVIAAAAARSNALPTR
jgi:polyene glycosyltransferase